MTHQGSCSVINHRLHQRLTLIRLTVQPFKTWRTETTVNTNMILKNKLRQRSAFSECAALPLYRTVLHLLDCNTGCFAYTLIRFCCCFFIYTKSWQIIIFFHYTWHCDNKIHRTIHRSRQDKGKTDNIKTLPKSQTRDKVPMNKYQRMVSKLSKIDGEV